MTKCIETPYCSLRLMENSTWETVTSYWPPSPPPAALTNPRTSGSAPRVPRYRTTLYRIVLLYYTASKRNKTLPQGLTASYSPTGRLRPFFLLTYLTRYCLKCTPVFFVVLKPVKHRPRSTAFLARASHSTALTCTDFHVLYCMQAAKPAGQVDFEKRRNIKLYY